MTLTNRNKLFIVQDIIFVIFLIVIFGIYLYARINGYVTPPPETREGFIASLFTYDFRAVIISICVISLYAPIGILILRSSFEKTRSTEAVCFACFLSCCEAEALRLLLPLFNMWRTFSPLFIFIGRAVLLSRFFCPMCFLVSVITESQNQRIYIGRNLSIALVVSIVLSAAMPLHTVDATGLCIVRWGFNALFQWLQLCLFLTTVASMFLNAWQHENIEMKHFTYGYVILINGYTTVIHSDSFTFLVIGIMLLVTGTSLYLKKLHQIYLWK